MRIAVAVPQFPTLSETFVLTHITGLIDRGHEVTIVAKASDTSGRVHADVERYGLLDRVVCPPPLGRGRKAVILGSLRRFLAASGRVKLGLLRDVLRYRHPWSCIAVIHLAASVEKLPPFDVVHCHYGTLGETAARLMDVGAWRAPLVTTYHAMDVTFAMPRALNFPRLRKLGALHLPISDRWRQKLLAVGFDPQRVRVQHMGVDVNRIPFRPRTAPADGIARIVTVARLSEKKGHAYAIDAVTQLLREDVKVQYDIVGDGELRADLEAQVRNANVGDAIRLTGPLPQAQVLDLLDQSHVMLLPSVTAADGDQEGIPVALMEAMASGLPVVSTLHSGIPELIDDGRSGYLVPERDVDALAARLRALIEHPELWPELGRAGRERVHDDFDLGKLNDRLIELYEQVVGAHDC